MKLDAQVRRMLAARFATAKEALAPCCSHKQFDAIVAWVAEIAAEAESGALRAERESTPVVKQSRSFADLPGAQRVDMGVAERLFLGLDPHAAPTPG